MSLHTSHDFVSDFPLLVCANSGASLLEFFFYLGLDLSAGVISLNPVFLEKKFDPVSFLDHVHLVVVFSEQHKSITEL